MIMNDRRTRLAVGATCAGAFLIAACGTDAGSRSPQPSASDTVTISNCGSDATFPQPAKRMFVNDSNLVSFVLSVGAADQITAVTNQERDETVLTAKYGDVVADLPNVGHDYPSLETVLAARPDVMVAGWNYGYQESSGLTPDALAEHDIAAYVLSESCRQDDGARGTMDPWDAVRADLANLGAITGHADTAADVTADLDARLAMLADAPQADKPPVVFVFDSGTDAIFTSGAFGGPQAVIEAAGGTNALSDVEDTWTEVGWERLTAADPDMIVFVDYPGQTFEEKKKVLATNPASRHLSAVEQQRYLNLPYAMWTSSPLNIDAAEHVRQGLESYDLEPASDIEPTLDLG